MIYGGRIQSALLHRQMIIKRTLMLGSLWLKTPRPMRAYLNSALQVLAFWLQVIATPLIAKEATATFTLTPAKVIENMQNVFAQHCLYREMTPELVKRQLKGFIELLDPSKSYFLKVEISPWLEAPSETYEKICHQIKAADFSSFESIYNIMEQAVQRRSDIISKLPKPEDEKVDRSKLHELDWPADKLELEQRLMLFKQLQQEILADIDPQKREIAKKRFEKTRMEIEEPFLDKRPARRTHECLKEFLRAFAHSLDAHTVYFTPEEAREFNSAIHRKITGIGVLLREELDGYRILRIIEGTPAALSQKLQVHDRIVAIDSQPTVGLELSKGVHLIQGPLGSRVTLTIQRPGQDGKTTTHTFELELKRENVVLEENRFRTSIEPFGKGAVGVIELYSFYQDGNDSCAKDLHKIITEMKQQNLSALVLDLRQNSGGLLKQAIDICSLFLKPGIIVSTLTPQGQFEHLRNFNKDPIWQGPLIVLVSKASASSSEIVAQALQDYGRALIVGDPHTFGKGTFQLFHSYGPQIPEYGVFTITQGIYYTVSGRSPQLIGVQSDIAVPGPLAQLEIGEQTLKYPLPNQKAQAHFDDTMDDVTFFDKQRLKYSYLPYLQKPTNVSPHLLAILRQNSLARIKTRETANKKRREEILVDEQVEPAKHKPSGIDMTEQQQECINIVKDWLYLLQNQEPAEAI